jgi:PAS domain S-box-containing protein
MDERELNDFFEHGAMALHWVGPDGTILRANRAELEMLGYAADEYIGRHIAEFHADAEAIEDILRRLTAGETLRNYPARLRCKDGSLRHVLISSNVQRDAQGGFVHTRCFTVDVTDRAQISELRSQTTDYLEGLMEGFVAYDGDWRMTYMNAAAERILGRRRADVLGKTWHQAFPHAVGNPVDLMYQRVMARRSAERMEILYEHYGHWFEISAAPVQSGGVAVYFRDISDRMRALEALREADRRKDEFLATLGHELRNPLAPIRNGLQLLAMSQPGSKAADEARVIMERQMRHLVRLVDDLLEVSRINTGKLELRRERVELTALVESAIETSRPLIDANRHELRVELPPDVVTLNADPVRIAQVLANLLNNAAKYTAQGGLIQLLARTEPAGIAIRVRDNGMGIAPELRPRLFERFARLGAAPDSYGGLGIGLSIARSLVELHGGTIEAHSDGPAKGSEFTVRLPVLSARPRMPVWPSADAALMSPNVRQSDAGTSN